MTTYYKRITHDQNGEYRGKLLSPEEHRLWAELVNMISGETLGVHSLYCGRAMTTEEIIQEHVAYAKDFPELPIPSSEVIEEVLEKLVLIGLVTKEERD